MQYIGSETNRFNPRGAGTTGASSSGGFGMRYPSPFFDVAQQFLPENQRQLLYWCRFYFLTNPIINAAVSKMAEYPVTKLIYETEDDNLRESYTKLEKILGLRRFQVELGLDYFTYGNAFVSVFLPFDRYLRCKKCGKRHLARESRSRYRWRNFNFQLQCARCNHVGAASVIDVAVKNIHGINLVRWNPENIALKHNDVTGKTQYFYRLPKGVRNDVKQGIRDAVETLPWDFIRAVKLGKQLRFQDNNFYHLKRPTLATKDAGWGTPLIFPLLRDAFYMQVMKKAQETLLMEHVVPLRVIFPGQNSMPDNAYSTINLSTWKSKIDSEISLWRRDNNYIPILPVNVGYQQLGGTAKALILHQEFRLHAEHMLAGAGIPVEFVFGGLQWSGTNTSLRALENMFLGYNMQREELLVDFILGRVSEFLGWPKIGARFDRFRMADDLQRSMFFFQLNQANKVSDRTMLEEVGLDFSRETERMDEELDKQLHTQRKMQVAGADIQGEAQLHTARYAAKAQALQMKAQMDIQQEVGMGGEGGEMPMDGGGGEEVQGGQGATSSLPPAVASLGSQLGADSMGNTGMDMAMVAKKVASYLKRVGEEQGQPAMHQELERLQMEDPNMYRMVIPFLNDTGSKANPMSAAQSPGATSQTDTSRAIG